MASRSLLIVMILSLAAAALPAQSDADAFFDVPMDSDPLLPASEPQSVFDERLIPLWLEALAKPDLELRVSAIEALREAHQLGMNEAHLHKSRLAAMLEEDNRLEVQRALIAALIAFDAQDSATALLSRAPACGKDMVMAVDRACAAWNDAGAQAQWLARLTDPGTDRTLLVSAIEGLATVKHAAAAPELEKLIGSQQADPSLRLSAARALGTIAQVGLEPQARDLAGGAMIDRLVAVSLLSSHSGEKREALLLELAQDTEPAVAAQAMGQLLATDPLLLKPIARQQTMNPDPKVRRLAAQALAAQRSGEAIEALGMLLNDLSPQVRTYVRDALIVLDADESLSAAVRQTGMTHLATEQWRELEQAALLLGKLDHEAAASRLIELLTFDRAETRVAAAVALRWLAVEETFAPMLAHAQALTEKALQDGYQALPEGQQLVEIFQLFGLRDYRASEPLLRRFIPKQRALHGAARGAAIWAIGRYHENDPSDAPLAASLAERLSDLSPFDPEQTEVRLASAIAIGRMKAASELEALRGFFDATRDDVVSRACRWSIMRITGESLPPPISPGRQYSDWFLKPIDTPAT